MQTVIKTEVDEESTVLHDDLQVKLEPPDHERKVEIKIELHPYPEVKEEVEGPMVLQKPEKSVLHDNVQVKLEPPDWELNVEPTEELHANHEFKEIIIGPVVLQKPGPPALVSRDVTVNSSAMKHLSCCGLCGQDIASCSSLTQHKCTCVENTSSSDTEEKGEQSATKFTYDICLRMFTCTICNKQFSRSSNLTRHKRVHSGDKPYSCTICNKQFTQNSNLLTHQRVHSGDKPYPCKICNKQFSQISHLKSHQIIHSGKRPYPCTICTRRFSDRSNLTKHERLHSGDKPHSCKICNKQFNHKSHLNRHERSHIEGFKPKARLKKRTPTMQEKQ